MNCHRRSSRLNLTCLIAARLCLIVSVWHAPVPWLHFHGTNLAEISPAASSLKTHLAIFHSAIELKADDDLGWHCHWVMPVWGHAIDDTPDDELPSQEVFAFDSATVPAAPLASASSPIIVGLLQFPLLPSMKFVERSFRRQGEILDPILRRDLFSVLRC